MKALITLLVVLLAFGANSQDLQGLLDKSNQNWDAGNYEDAFQNLNSAVEEAKNAHAEDPEGYTYSYAVILNQMGIRLFQAENYETAASYYEAAIPLFEQDPGTASEDYLISLENLALCYNTGGFYGAALPVYQQLIDNPTYQEQNGKDIYQTYNTAAICAYQAGDYEVAKRHYQKGLSYLTQSDADYWTLIENLAVLETTWGNYQEAYNYIAPLIEQFPEKEAQYTNDIAYYNRDMGHGYFNQGDYLQALPYFKETIKYLKPTDSIAELSIVYIYEDITATYSNLRNFQAGIQYMEKNGSQVKDHYGENSLDYLYALSHLTIAHAELGNYKKSNSYFKKAYRIIDQLATKEQGEIRALFDTNYADYFIKQGDYDKAEYYARRSYEFYAENGNQYLDDQIFALNMIGIVLLSQGEYDQGESVLKQALNLQQTHRGIENEMGSQIASNLTSLYIQTGRNSRAEKFLQFLLANDRAIHGEKSTEYSFALQVAGVLYTSTGNFDKAIEYLDEAYEIRKPLVGENNRELLRLKKTLGSAYLKANDLDKSVEILSEVLDQQIATLGNKNFDISLTQNDLGLAHLLKKDYSKAKKLFQKSYELDKDILGQYNQFTVTSQYNLACTNILMGNQEKAFSYFQKSVNDYLYILDAYFPYLSEKERIEYYYTIKGQIGAYFSFLKDNLESHPEYSAILYDLQIKTKAILLSESLKLRNSLVNHENPDVKNIFQQWNNINKEIAKLEQVAKDEATTIRLDSLKIVGEEYERALNSMTNLAIEVKKKTWKDVSATLKDGEVAIEIIRIRDFDFENNKYVKEKVSYLALIIDNQTTNFPKYVLLPDGSAMDSKYFNVYKNSIKFKKQDKLSYEYFWKPIAEAIDQYDKAYISSDGVYHLLNINTLLNPVTDQYVINEFDIEIVGNTSELLNNDSANESIERAVLFGFPNFNTKPDTETENEQRTAIYQEIFSSGVSDLPETKTEVENIVDMMSSTGITTNSFLADDASEQQLKAITSTDILHIATHGFFEESSANIVKDDPLMHSGLLLANLKESTGLEEENGIFTAKEVANMDLSDNKLVVLSACETGKGKVVNGEGVYGLQRAFQVAGADNVIISLWKVDDTATQKLMTYFYDHYLKSLNPREALKKSQIKLQTDYPHPNYWGAFYVVGE